MMRRTFQWLRPSFAALCCLAAWGIAGAGERPPAPVRNPATAPAAKDDNDVEAWLRSIETLKWSDLPLKWALTTRRGTGRRQIAVFSDPNCAFCRRFEADLAKLDDTTVHIFMYPVLSPKSVAEAKAVWCSRDRVKAWTALMQQGVAPVAAAACDTRPIDALTELGNKYNIKMTPTWILPNSERYQGAFTLEDIVPLLDRASPPSKR